MPLSKSTQGLILATSNSPIPRNAIVGDDTRISDGEYMTALILVGLIAVATHQQLTAQVPLL
jgi:hypothetical protein